MDPLIIVGEVDVPVVDQVVEVAVLEEVEEEVEGRAVLVVGEGIYTIIIAVAIPIMSA